MKFEWKFRPGGKEKTGLSTFKFIFAVLVIFSFPSYSLLTSRFRREREKKEGKND
jgi:hypothetical protein